jgi:hypothetical protein
MVEGSFIPGRYTTGSGRKYELIMRGTVDEAMVYTDVDEDVDVLTDDMISGHQAS